MSRPICPYTFGAFTKVVEAADDAVPGELHKALAAFQEFYMGSNTAGDAEIIGPLIGTKFHEHLIQVYDYYVFLGWEFDPLTVIVDAVIKWNSDYGTKFDPETIARAFIHTLPIDFDKPKRGN